MSRPRGNWDNIIEIDLQEMVCVRMDCICLCQDWEMGKFGGKSPLSRPRRKCYDIIGIDLQEVGCGRMDYIGL